MSEARSEDRLDRYEDDLQSKVERLHLMQVKPGWIAKALNLKMSEVADRIRKVEDDLADMVRMSSPHRIMVIFGSLIARSRTRYAMLAEMHDAGIDQLGAIKAMKEEDKYVADLLIRPVEIAKALGGYTESVSVDVLPLGADDGPDDDDDEGEFGSITGRTDPTEEIESYNVIQKATRSWRGKALS